MAELAQVMAEIAQRIRAEPRRPPVEETLGAITRAAVEAVPGADDAGISYKTGPRIEARGATGPRPAALDRLQDELGQGPCYAAIRRHPVVQCPDMATEERWPRFAAAAREHGVGSMLSIRLFVIAKHRLGALNLYATTAHAFDEDAEEIARVFAVHAAIALASAEREEHLEAALRSRDRISQAKGILMERFKLTADDAFRMLARTSSVTNRKIKDVAEEVATSGELPA
jgi:GAF domain-containing protein